MVRRLLQLLRMWNKEGDEIQPKECFHWCHVELEWMEEVHVALFFGSDLFVSKRYRPFLVAFIFPMSHRDKKLIKKCTDLYCMFARVSPHVGSLRGA